MPLSAAENLNKTMNTSGFSLVELIVVMFILSILAFFTIPLFKAPATGLAESGDESRKLALFIESLKQQAVKTHQDHLLHIDLVSGQAWATTETRESNLAMENTEDGYRPEPEKESALEISLEGLSISQINFADQADRDLEDTVIRISRKGISDMALIHMDTEEGEEVTLRLHPFINDVEIIQGSYTFHDCQ